jgi:hypothetical protein
VSAPGQLRRFDRTLVTSGLHPVLTFLRGSKALANVRFGADCGLKSDVASGPKVPPGDIADLV